MHRETRNTRLTAITVAMLAITMTGCTGASKALSEDSKCGDWNTADINAQGTSLQAEYKKIDHLNKYTGYASSGVSYYCADNPRASLADITRKVAIQ